MRESLSRIGTLTKRNIKEILRDPLSLIFMMALPLVMEIMFYFLFHDKTDQFEMKYLAPGIVVFSQAFLSLFTGILISTDRNQAFLTRLYVSKARSHEFILGYAIAVLPAAAVQSVVFFAVGGIFDPSLFSLRMILAIVASLFTSILFIGLGILIGTLCSERSVGGVSSIVITGQSLLSGMWFPIEGMNGAVVTVMKCLPFKNATDAVQNVLLGTDDPMRGIVFPLLIVLAYTLVTLICAVALFKRKMESR